MAGREIAFSTPPPPHRWGFQRGAVGSSSPQSSQHHFLLPFASLALRLETRATRPAGATRGDCTPPSPGTLVHGLSPATMAPELSLPCHASWVWRWWHRKATPAPGSGSRPPPPALILSPQDLARPCREKVLVGMLSSPVRLCLKVAPPSLSSAG